jgi:hypothetical protein
MAYRMSSGDNECLPPLDRPGVRLLWCLDLAVLEANVRGLATSAIEPLVVGDGSASPLSSRSPSSSS